MRRITLYKLQEAICKVPVGMTGLSIVLSIVKSFNSVLGIFERESALNQAEQYLIKKYGLKSEQYTIVQVGSYPNGFYVYDEGWTTALCDRTREIRNAKTITLPLTSVCEDFVMLVAVLAERGADHMDIKPSCRFAEKMFKTKTYDSAVALSRGLGSDVALQIVERELKAWCDEFSLL